jgi:hypothetical protein
VHEAILTALQPITHFNFFNLRKGRISFRGNLLENSKNQDSSVDIETGLENMRFFLSMR